MWYGILRSLIDAIASMVIFGVLPILIVWLCLKYKKHENESRTKIVMAALEKNGEIDVQDFFDKLTPKQRPFKEKLMMRLHWEVLIGSLLTIYGLLAFIVLIVMGISCGGFQNVNADIIAILCVTGIPTLAIGAGFLIAYFTGKKTLKQLEKED